MILNGQPVGPPISLRSIIASYSVAPVIVPILLAIGLISATLYTTQSAPNVTSVTTQK